MKTSTKYLCFVSFFTCFFKCAVWWHSRRDNHFKTSCTGEENEKIKLLCLCLGKSFKIYLILSLRLFTFLFPLVPLGAFFISNFNVLSRHDSRCQQQLCHNLTQFVFAKTIPFCSVLLGERWTERGRNLRGAGYTLTLLTLFAPSWVEHKASPATTSAVHHDLEIPAKPHPRSFRSASVVLL